MKNLIFISSLVLLFLACEFDKGPARLDLGKDYQTQNFTIDQSADITIKGAKGTLIQIGNNSFVDEFGNPVKKVEVSLEEFYTIDDFISNRLSTKTTDGKLLNSSGMVNIQAKSKNNEVFLKEGVSIKIGFPRIQDSRVTNLFTAVKGINDEIVWELADPIHLDTTVYGTETIEMLAYGAEKVTIEIYAIIGYDTVDINEDNYQFFEKYPVNYLEGLWLERASDSTNTDSFYEGGYFRRDKYYIFEITDLGLINCDIFIDQELFPFIVQTAHLHSDVFIVLEEMNSVIYPDYNPNEDHRYYFNLPGNTPIAVVGYAIENETHLFDLARTNTSGSEIKLNLKPKELEQIELAIKNLN
jgi:hypothetical protein